MSKLKQYLNEEREKIRTKHSLDKKMFQWLRDTLDKSDIKYCINNDGLIVYNAYMRIKVTDSFCNCSCLSLSRRDNYVPDYLTKNGALNAKLNKDSTLQAIAKRIALVEHNGDQYKR